MDLALIADENFDRVSRIRYMLNEELPTPYFYDVVLLDTLTNEALKQQILKDGKPIYSKRH